tara:strand:+ start:64 stop:1272 length:1209 start_codon:yes stop_codon:yes gene_type:complete
MKTKAKLLKSLKLKEKRYDVKLPDEGLYARVYPSGRIAIQYVYKFNYVRRRINIGYFPENKVAELEDEFYKRRSERKIGKDPQVERLEKRREERKARKRAKLAKTVGELGHQFVADHSELNKSVQAAREDLRILKREIIPFIGNMGIEEVERHHLAEIVTKITRRGSPVMANRVRAFLSKMFNYGIDNGLLEVNPATRLPSNKEMIRQRVLSDEELCKFWRAIDSVINLSQQSAIRVLLLTGQRRSEVARMTRKELEGNWWVIPADRSKNHIAHRVPLTGKVRDLVKGENFWVFPGRRTNYVHPDTLTDRVPEIAKKAGIEHCTVHDLRRTVGTYIRSKYGAEVMHKTLNHKDDRLTATYGVHDFDQEKKRALETWSRHLDALLGDRDRSGNVVELRGNSNN